MEKQKKSFALGYSLVLHAFISFMFISFVLVTMSNMVFPDFIKKFAPLQGDRLWNQTTLSLANTVCAIVAAVIGVLLGQWVDRRGPKQVLVVGFLVGAADLLIFPFVPNFACFCVCLAVIHIAMLAYAQMTASNLLAHWFIRKKGLALGIAAIGIPAGNAVFLKLYELLSGSFGMIIALWFFGIILLAMGVLSIFWVRNTPQEAGLTPDNLPMQEDGAVPTDRSYRLSEVIRTPKVWLLMLITGLPNCAVIACVAQIRDYVIEKGIADSSATLIVSLGALGGIVGGFIFSAIDQKLGPKKTLILYSVVSLAVYLTMYIAPAGSAALIMVLCMLTFALNGAPANLGPSLILTIFGSESYNSVGKVATPAACILRALGFYVATLLMRTIGGGTWAGVYLGVSVIVAVVLILTVLCKEEPSQIWTKAEDSDIFARGEAYFGFNSRFQGDIMKIKELIYGRDVTGKYLDAPISQKDVEEIVEAGTMVPEHVSVQPWHFVAVSDPATLRELNGLMHGEVERFAAKLRERFPGHPEIKRDTEQFMESLFRAPLVVMAFTDYPCRDEALAEQIKLIGSAFQNMLLEAYGKGIGSCWLTSPIAAGIAPALCERFSAGEGEFIGIVTFGYFDRDARRNVVRKAQVRYISGPDEA